MPKYSEKFINERNKIYQENNKLLDMLYAVYKGNFIQRQAKGICFKYNYKREIKKGGEIQTTSYTENTFNNLFRKLEEYNLIDRKKFKDTNNLCVSFKKSLISMILNIPQDKISANRNAMNNSTNEVFTLSLFKGYAFKQYCNKIKTDLSNYNYDKLIEIFRFSFTNIFLTDADILKFYEIIEAFSKSNNENYNSFYLRHTKKIEEKINNIKDVREIKSGNKNIEIHSTKRNTAKSRGQLFLDNYDLISLKRRKIFLNRLTRNKDELYFNIDIYVLNNKYSYQKILKDIGETVSSICELLRDIGRRCRLMIEIVGYNKEKMAYFNEEFKKERKYKSNGIGAYFYESNKNKIIEKYKNYKSGFDIDFIFRYVNFEKYIGKGFTIQ